MLERARNATKLSGGQLLVETDGKYNEVVAVAHTEGGGDVRLKGFFYKTTPEGQPYDVAMTQKMTSHALRLGLPIVQIIHDETVYKNDEVKRTDGDIAVHLGGVRYTLKGYGDFNFQVIDQMFHNHFMAPSQAEKALEYALKLGAISGEEADAIRVDYRRAVHKRETPTATFSEDGDFVEVTCLSGYGNTEERIFIGRWAYCHRTNTRQIAQSIQDYQVSGGASMNSTAAPTPLSPEETEKYVEMACSELTEAQASVLRKWFAENAAKIEQRYQEQPRALKLAGYFGLRG